MARLWTLLFGCACVLLSGAGGDFGGPVEPPERSPSAGTDPGLLRRFQRRSWSDHFNRTQIGHLMAKPVMKPFTKDFQRQIEERWSSVHDRLGLSLQDLKGVPGGDVGIGLVELGSKNAQIRRSATSGRRSPLSWMLPARCRTPGKCCSESSPLN